MPHPLVIVAGVAIVVGASYMIYNEVTARNSQRQEDAYNDYCATMKAEKEARDKRLLKEKLERIDDKDSNQSGQDDDEQDLLLPHHHQKISPRLSHLRRRRNTRDDQSSSTRRNQYAPLIDLSEQCYPPRNNTQQLPERLSTSPNYEEEEERELTPKDSNSVIFAAPTELLEQESKDNIQAPEIKSPSPLVVQQDDRLIIPSTTNYPIIIVNSPREQQEFNTNSSDFNKDLSSSSSSSRVTFDPIVSEIKCSIAQDYNDEDADENNNNVLKDVNSQSEITLDTTSALESFDDGWSDLGSETFETV